VFCCRVREEGEEENGRGEGAQAEGRDGGRGVGFAMLLRFGGVKRRGASRSKLPWVSGKAPLWYMLELGMGLSALSVLRFAVCAPVRFEGCRWVCNFVLLNFRGRGGSFAVPGRLGVGIGLRTAAALCPRLPFFPGGSTIEHAVDGLGGAEAVRGGGVRRAFHVSSLLLRGG